MDKKQKKKQIVELTNEQFTLLKKAAAVAKLPKGKRPSTEMKRMWKLVEYAMKIRALQLQKQIIASQPIAPEFLRSGIDSIGEHGNELPIIRDGKILNIPPLPKCVFNGTINFKC